MLMKLNFLKHISIISIILIALNSCGGLPKPDWSKPAEPDGRKRAQQNVLEGRGIKFGSKKDTGNFTFATSNPLWRATLDTVDFMGLSSVDYGGGLIITDWYSENNYNESIKITLRFLSPEIRVDAIDIDIRKRECQTTNNCIVKKIETNLENEILDMILKRAAKYEVEFKQEQKKNLPKKVWKPNS